MRHKMQWFLAIILFSQLSFATAAHDFSLNDWDKQDNNFKITFITAWIDIAKHDAVTIRLPPKYYVKRLDALVNNIKIHNQPQALQESVGVALKAISIMDCDWDNGQNRLQYAKDYFGDNNFNAFKELYPEKYNKLANNCVSPTT